MIDMKVLRKIVERMIRPLRTRILMINARAVVESLKDDGGLQLMKLNVLAGENPNDVERFQNYGFTSSPKPGAEAVVIFQGGNREHGLIIAVDDRRFRLKALAEGEVAIYTDEGDKIHFKRGGVIQIVASSKVEVNADLVELGNGTLEKILNGETFQTRFNDHKHIGNAGVSTGKPITPSPASDLSNVVKGAK